jgi:hypothetical protein
MEEKQFNVVISRLKKKMLFNRPLLDDKNILHPELKYKPDSEGFKIEINFVMTAAPTPSQPTVTEEGPSNEVSNQESNEVSEQVIPVEYKHDAAKAPVIEEEQFDFTISSPDE